ncbi:FtsQ-type POTRA domain-containing protein [Frigoribacterium sp. PvP032]|uniref:FtsQ-type POTRA domain-containing protein n=1 Tax=Frigoribacterium sp. PvP032 TaxID=2806589 RepID=UPI001B5DAA7E|nr:FtsQ-type POTRA domain-containing protein [Frigoribacterium sp. PvP032]MBP1190969.1 cell division protein FtsQ [Frigoribacterium sp. PvP032]
MRRPEGFDPSAEGSSDEPGTEEAARASSLRDRLAAARARRARPESAGAPPTSAHADDTPTGPVTLPTSAAPASVVPGAASRLVSGVTSRLGPRGGASASDRPDVGAAGTSTPDTPRIDPASGAEEARRRAAEARRAARRASGERRRTERTEVRRFTRRSRHRRAAWVTAGAVAALLVASVAVAVFSPLLSLEQIEVEGTDRVDAAEVQAAVSDQLGTPLARIDFGRITTELERFPLIASYVTETAPPHTLVIRVTERQPIATVPSGDGFDLVDPAGIVVQHLDARQDGVPLVDVGGAPLDDTAFRSAAEVLLALPQALRQTVDSATASTADDVTLSLTTGERVVWGSADHSAEKAQVLAGLIADQARRDPAASVEFDVSAPDNGIIRTR